MSSAARRIGRDVGGAMFGAVTPERTTSRRRRGSALERLRRLR
jgi:hypothetical protein